MKNILFASALVITSLSSFAQKVDPKDVPAPVMAKFSAFYSDIKKVKWEKEGNNFEAKFKSADKKAMSVIYTPEGNLWEKVWMIKKTELPKAVSDSLAKKFPGAKPEECEKIDRNGLNLYQVEFDTKDKDNKKIEMQVEFTPEGKVWAKKSENESMEKKKEGDKKEVKKEEKKDDKKDQK